MYQDVKEQTRMVEAENNDKMVKNKPEKILNFMRKYLSTKFFIILAILLYLVCIMGICIINFDGVKELFVYPEEEYKYLESLANEIVLNHNFDIDAEYTFSGSYNENYKTLLIEMYEGRARLTVNINDYGLDTQRAYIERNYDKYLNFILNSTFDLLLIPFFFVGVIMVIFIVVCIVIMESCNIIITRRKNRKRKV